MKKYFSITLLITGLLELWNVISHIAHFNYPDWFYIANPNIEKYIGTNVVSYWADFNYFTYHSVLLFSIWAILLGISELCHLSKVNTFVRKDGVIAFIFTNYVITVILYTLFELISGNPTFGYYGNSNLSIHNLGTNLLTHYIVFIIALFAYIKVKASTRSSKYLYITITTYLILYYVIVKITGNYAFNIVWYPYIIFDVEAIGLLVGSSNYIISIILLIFTNIIIFSFYMILFTFFWRIKKKNCIN